MRTSQIMYCLLTLDIIGLCAVMFAGFTNQLNPYTFAISAAVLVAGAIQALIIAKVVEIFEDSNSALQRIADRLDSQTR